MAAAPGCSLISQLTGPTSLSIQTFSASPSTVSSGSFTTLTWNVAGADAVTLDNGIGTVDAKGTRTVQLLWTTAFTLSAKSGTNSTSQTLQVQVVPLSPSPSPSPIVSPSPHPSPGASPTPQPSPSASPTPNPNGCAPPAGWAGSCSVRISYPTALPETQCVQVTNVTVTPDCPVGGGVVRQLTIDTSASSDQSTFVWRGASQSADVLNPPSGTINGNGKTELKIQDTVGDSVMKFEIVDSQGNVLLRLTLSNL